jgi:hypothetical protein
MNTVVRQALRVPYTLIRPPLAVLSGQVLSRLPEGSRARNTLARGLAVFDAVGGQVMADGGAQQPQQQPQQPEQPQRSEQRQQSGGESVSGPDEAEQDLLAEQERAAAALLEEQQTQPHVGELAEADEAEQKRLAELRAKHLVAEKLDEQHAKERIAAVQAREKRAGK